MPPNDILPTSIPVALKPATIGSNIGEISFGGTQTFTYDGQAGETLTIRVFADNPVNTANPTEIRDSELLDTFVTVLQPDRSPLDDNDDIKRGRTDSLIEDLELSEAGTYQIEVRSSKNRSGGAFTLLIQSSMAVTGGLPDLVIPQIEGQERICIFATPTPRLGIVGNNILATWSNVPVAFPSGQEMIEKQATFTLEVANYGDGNSQDFAVTTFSISKADFDDTLEQSGTIDVETFFDIYQSFFVDPPQPVAVSGLRPGEVRIIDVDVVFFGDGDQVMIAVADFDDAINEINQENNTLDYNIFLDSGC